MLLCSLVYFAPEHTFSLNKFFRYPWNGELCPPIYQDRPADDRSRKDTRHRRRRAPPGVAAAVAVPAAASLPAPVPVCRRRVPYRRLRCLPEAATSPERRNTPAIPRSRDDNPAGTRLPQLLGEHRHSLHVYQKISEEIFICGRNAPINRSNYYD